MVVFEQDYPDRAPKRIQHKYTAGTGGRTVERRGKWGGRQQKIKPEVGKRLSSSGPDAHTGNLPDVFQIQRYQSAVPSCTPSLTRSSAHLEVQHPQCPTPNLFKAFPPETGRKDRGDMGHWSRRRPRPSSSHARHGSANSPDGRHVQ
ncbi:hypothetical protein BaRGS_00007850, partial [Batillaria attramentaria]